MENENIRRVHAIITGRVQGVAYRWYTREAAQDLGIEGWVKNLPDGSVELVAEGPEEAIEKFLAWCRRGPSLAEVSDVKVESGQARGDLGGFSIRH